MQEGSASLAKVFLYEQEQNRTQRQTYQIDTILLHLLVPILQDGSETGQQVLDGWGHFGHTDDVHYGLEGTENRAQHLGVLLTEILV